VAVADVERRVTPIEGDPLSFDCEGKGLERKGNEREDYRRDSKGLVPTATLLLTGKPQEASHLNHTVTTTAPHLYHYSTAQQPQLDPY